MTPMYETIMNLPLFSGLSENQLSFFLEKTPIGFSQYEPGDIIMHRKEYVNSLKCLIGGSVEISHVALYPESLTITETIESPAILGGEKLFGMDREIESDIICGEKASVMELSKEKYLKLLQSDEIYLINYLNYLSIRAQAVQKILPAKTERTLREVIISMLNSYTSRNATIVKFSYSYLAFVDYCGLTESAFDAQLDKLHKSGLIEKPIAHNQYTASFIIPSKNNFLTD